MTEFHNVVHEDEHILVLSPSGEVRDPRWKQKVLVDPGVWEQVQLDVAFMAALRERSRELDQTKPAQPSPPPGQRVMRVEVWGQGDTLLSATAVPIMSGEGQVGPWRDGPLEVSHVKVMAI